MRKTFVCEITFFCLMFLLTQGLPFFALAASGETSIQAKALLIRNVNVVDVINEKISSSQNVLIQQGKIAQIAPYQSPTESTANSLDIQVIDATNQFLIPGLWDMHVHNSTDETARKTILPLFIVNGITSVRDMKADCLKCDYYGDYPYSLVQLWQTEINQNKLIGPRIVGSSDIINGPRNGVASEIWPATESQGRSLAQIVKSRGPSFIKVYNALPREAFFGIANEALKLDLSLAGHVPVGVRASEASNAGMTSMEHLIGVMEECSSEETRLRADLVDSFRAEKLQLLPVIEQLINSFDEKKCEQLLKIFKVNNTWHVPTLTIYASRDWRANDKLKYVVKEERKFWEVLEASERAAFAGKAEPEILGWMALNKQIVKMLHQAGVKVLAGSDSGHWGIFTGFGLHRELELLVEAGLSPATTLKAATIYPAEFFSRSHELGSIEVGKLADAILLNKNPLIDIKHTQSISAVISNGRFYSREQLELLLATAEKYVINSNLINQPP